MCTQYNYTNKEVGIYMMFLPPIIMIIHCTYTFGNSSFCVNRPKDRTSPLRNTTISWKHAVATNKRTVCVRALWNLFYLIISTKVQAHSSTLSVLLDLLLLH